MSQEWLLADGLGGYAMGTVSRVPTRTYHGNLVAAVNPPRGRHLIMGPVILELIADGRRTPLWSGEWGPGQVLPASPGVVKGFRLAQGMPEHTWQVGEATLTEAICLPHRQQAVILRYRFHSPRPARLELVPLVSGRNHHGGELPPLKIVSAEASGLLVELAGRVWRLELKGGGGYRNDAQRYAHWYYREEAARGLNPWDDLWAPGRFWVDWPAGAHVAELVMAPVGSAVADDPGTAWDGEVARRAALAARAPRLPAELVFAADAFLVEDSHGRPTVIAGYPWFTDWGRDTMIALPGLTDATGQSALGDAILRHWVGLIGEGLLPNRFPDEGEEPEMNSVDAILWFVVRVGQRIKQAGDAQLAAVMLDPIDQALAALSAGTLFGIGMDPEDGLLKAGWPGYALTWMDARVGDWVVTPRAGKPVEIQALWYNALRLRDDMAELVGRAARFDALAKQVFDSVGRLFRRPDGLGLYDVISEDGRPDPALRPNQLYALALPYPVVGPDDYAPILNTVRTRLFTPLGLYSLAPGEPAFQAHYGGSAAERDGAYHQGTVWSFMLGAFIDAVYRADPDEGDRLLADVTRALSAHLGETGLGSVSEIFDPTTLVGVGCPFQAWGVAEAIRIFRRAERTDRGQKEAL